jgi:DNA excision repair protein ERCC-2
LSAVAEGGVRVEISVRELVRLTCRRGDIRRGSGPRGSALEGQRAHRAIQLSRDGGYEAEHRLETARARGGVELVVSGRADGVDLSADPPLVEEIKSVATPLILLHEGERPLDFAQADAYAAMLAAKTGAKRVRVRLAYVHRETDEVRVFERVSSAAELEAFFDGAAARLAARLALVLDRRRERDATIAALPFPYARPRPGQLDLAEATAASIAKGERLLAHVPTGAGKTMAILYGALRAVSRGAADQLLFLTSRGTGRNAVKKALADLRAEGLRCTSLELNAREKICPRPLAECDAASCPVARGHYDRIDAAAAALNAIDDAHGAAVEAIAAAHRVCPFELAMELVPFSDIVIGDLNYALDPHVSPKVMQGFTLGTRALLVDEAHNAIDRAREMFSARLSSREARDAARSAKAIDPQAARGAAALARAIDAVAGRALGEAMRAAALEGAPPRIVRAASLFIERADIGLASRPRLRAAPAFSPLYFRALEFVSRAGRLDDGFAPFAARVGGEAAVELYCVDPRAQIAEAWRGVRASVLFSGTLAPLDYFSRLLGGTASFVGSSPFPPESLRALAADAVDTRYSARGATLGAVVDLIARAVRSRPGGHLAFFPSYEYLAAAADRFAAIAPEIVLSRQSPSMDDVARRAFLAGLTGQGGAGRVGFAVLGGIFGESVELDGSSLAGAIVVTVGLPPPDPRREAVRAHFDERDGAGAGVGFAYVFPGANKVLQALGRVVRKETDRGYALLVDARLSKEPYRSLLLGGFDRVERVRDAADVERALGR